MSTPNNTPAPDKKKQNQSFASDGTSFDPRSDIWKFRTLSGAVTLDFGLLRENATSTFVLDAKTAMKVLVETRNLQSVRAAYLQFRKLVVVAHQRQDMLIDQIDPEDIASWCGSGNAAYIGQLRPIFEIWKTLQLKGIEQETSEFIDKIRTLTSGDKEGVRTWNPDTGAYRPAEDAALKTALDAGFNDGSISLYDYALARTFRGFGLRPVQLASMKIGDIRRSGERVEVRIPLAKRRGMSERGGFLPWKPITQGLAEILFLHISTNILGRVLEEQNSDLAQLFPPKRPEWLTISENVEAHQVNGPITKAYVNLFKRLKVVSPITGRLIIVSPQRERHTVLTGLAMLGCNSKEIAANAGHADPRSCEPYVDASIDHFQRMERLVGEAFIPIADRFLGKVLREDQDRTASNDPNAVLRDRSMTPLRVPALTRPITPFQHAPGLSRMRSLQ